MRFGMASGLLVSRSLNIREGSWAVTEQQRNKNNKWVVETWDCGFSGGYEITDELHGEETPFQDMRLVNSRMFGKMLLLDGFVQTTEKDEFIYHEMMTHVPMVSHGNAKNVLIIGGGDGGILREVLRYPSVEKAVMVEIDQRVIDFSREHLPSISDGAFDDPRTTLVIADGAEYVKNTKCRFDVVIVDSSDPIGPATVLFTSEFYQNIANILTENGFMSRQSGSTWGQPAELAEAYKLVSSIFRYSSAYVFNVPTYIGGLFSSLICSRGTDPQAIELDKISRQACHLEGMTKYYNPGVHFGSLQLPGYIKERVV